MWAFIESILHKTHDIRIIDVYVVYYTTGILFNKFVIQYYAISVLTGITQKDILNIKIKFASRIYSRSSKVKQKWIPAHIDAFRVW